MKPLSLSLSLFALLLATTSLHAETAREIAAKFETQKIEAINAYLEANPEAEDIDAALSILVGANMSMGKFEPLPDLLEKRYDLQPKGPGANLQVIMQEIARPMIESSILADQRDKAKAFITRVKTDFGGNPQISGILDQWGAELYLPNVGDTMEFAFTDTKGNEVDLAEMRDKVILVDFWATWCGPCVAELPHLLETYAKYKDKGFEIVGISLDDNVDTLNAFVEQNKMTWPQYFDGKAWGNEIAQKYGISAIPATFLVGKDGKIVASSLRGNALEQAVEKALAAE
ncbi:MAG: TlpA family protein disulfide reductase [Verrucomicrobiales bacterium]|nr:TlpA family protein disulfide reductase [Verrucomicrobiales bacterium]